MARTKSRVFAVSAILTGLWLTGGAAIAQTTGTYRNECAPNSNFGKAIAWQTPRLIRIGARVSF